jgi:hypothetical protein
VKRKKVIIVSNQKEEIHTKNELKVDRKDMIQIYFQEIMIIYNFKTYENFYIQFIPFISF